MRALASIVLMATCLGLAGCSLFGKKNSSNPSSGNTSQPAASINRPTTYPPTGSGGGFAGAPPPPGEVGGLLAGQVVDSYNRPRPITYIRVVPPADAGGSTKAAPIEVATDAQGYFTIQGLRPGKHYQLIARTNEGDHLLAGATFATPPDPKVLIRISEDFATDSTPPIPPPPSLGGKKNDVAPPPQWPDKDKAGSTDGAAPKTNAVPPNRAELGSPSSGDSPTPRTESIARDPKGTQRTLLNVPAQAPREDPQSPPTRPETAPPAPTASTPNVPTRIPSCVLTGRQLVNFALYDLNGQPWEFRKRQGKIVLLDFWGTWCPHCVEGIPTMNILQDRYAREGLEVIGVAYEHGTPQQQAQKVQRVCGLKRINYLILMGSGLDNDCPVRSQFNLHYFPTYVLLDENGRIAWRCDQGLDREKLQELELHIRQLLMAR